MQNPHSSILVARLEAEITGTGGSITPSLPALKPEPRPLPAMASYANDLVRLA